MADERPLILVQLTIDIRRLVFQANFEIIFMMIYDIRMSTGLAED
ncbi:MULTISPECIES: hypothetical protein [Lactiplantibacillus]|jgi:hypothetical protein|uniref:Uncharacterized protein n=1 Tax=Lactiplantibacillus pentosus TaxID=1589 RepID=A0AAX6LFP4_LACPE|nr:MULTISPECIES: hypothetical protein [Lactiplantibacillus]BBM21248.1 hypothetical protein SN13T_1283 [Lactiplantibacillus plantarum]MDF2313375.1 hypothetical protein [Lactiplantibacillus pentosus]MDY1544004.1 hypothetical protein [Lactiplantibacillus pentosus]UXI97811.1 hypothetical protein N5A89_02275 [Lactiplantibacillus pentosus]UZO89000.1 hypothetical protein HPK28_02415 [Lactiplantibacillus pentosus]